MNNYEEYNTTLNYLLASALDDLEQEDSEYFLDRHETEQIESYVHDNDCDIINELIDCMKEQIREKVEEIVENREHVYNVCFNINSDINISIKGREEDIDELCNSWKFKRYLIESLDEDNIDIDIDHISEDDERYVEVFAKEWLD